jgi:hypothetical protein
VSWFQVRIAQSEEDGRLRVPIAARSRSLHGAVSKLDGLRRDGVDDARLGIFQPTRRDGSTGRWWRMPRVLA